MKCQVLTQESSQWLVLTPENKFEEGVLNLFEGMPNVSRGEFRQCQAGFMRSWNEKCGHREDLIIKFKSNGESNGS